MAHGLLTVKACAATVVAAAADLVCGSVVATLAPAICIDSVIFDVYLLSSCVAPQAENRCHPGRSCVFLADNPYWPLLQLLLRSLSQHAVRRFWATWPPRDAMVCPHCVGAVVRVVLAVVVVVVAVAATVTDVC